MRLTKHKNGIKTRMVQQFLCISYNCTNILIYEIVYMSSCCSGNVMAARASDDTFFSYLS